LCPANFIGVFISIKFHSNPSQRAPYPRSSVD
jgi:hypothetical protein